MMMAIGGIVILAQFALAGIVGVRLLRLPVSDRLAPERVLGAYFVLGLFAGGLLVTAAYAGWQQAGQLESPPWVVGSHALGQLLLGLGYASMFVFTWVTFYRDAAWARGFVALGAAALVSSYLGRVFVEGFAISVDPGSFHWLGYGARIVGLAWMAVAATSYWLQIRKRRRLGLADPLVTNRFALWAIFAVTQIMTAMSEPLARFFYAFVAGASAKSSEGVQNVAGEVIEFTLYFSSFWGSAGIAALFLTFFPTAAYKRWVLGERA
jgi:hypothetical protein